MDPVEEAHGPPINNPLAEDSDSLAAEESRTGGIEGLPSRLQRYAGGRRRALEMMHYCRTLIPQDIPLQQRIDDKKRRLADEIELRGKVAEDEGEHRDTILSVGGNRPEQRDDEQEKRKERQQRVVRDRGRERQVVAAVEIDGTFDDRQAAESNFAPEPARPAPDAGHAEIID